MISNNEFDDWGQSQQSGQDDNPEANAGVDLMQVAMRRKGLIALGIFVGLCLGLLYYARATPIYESVALLSITANDPPMTAQGGIERAFQMTTPAEDHAIRIKTPKIIGDAMEMNDGALAALDSLASEESPVETIYENLEVQPVKDGSEVLTLNYRGTSAEDSQMILDYVVNSYRSFLDQGQRNIGSEMKAWITDAKDKLEERLLKKRGELDKFRLENPQLFYLDEDGSNIFHTRQVALETLRFERQQELDRIEIDLQLLTNGMDRKWDPRALLMLVETGAAGSVDESYTERMLQVEKFRGEFNKQIRSEERGVPLRMQILMLEQRFGPDHPRLKALRKQIRMADDYKTEDTDQLANFKVSDDRMKLAQEKLENYVKKLRMQLAGGKQELKNLDEKFEQQRGDAEAIAILSAKHRGMLDDIERDNSMFDAIVKQVTDVNLLDAYGDNNDKVDVLQRPAEGEKVAPSLAKSLAAGTMLGFLGGFGLGYLVEMFDKTFRSPQEVSKILQLPMIGHIPEIVCEKPPESALAEVLVTAHKPKSPLAENFRAIRTALYFSAGNQQASVIQTTSPVPGDGKSTLTANIAITIAQSNKSILLIDADFRRPTQHKLFGLSNEVGLSSVVTGEAEPDVATQTTEVPNLYLMSCGPRPHNPSELLTSPQFADLLEVFREQYDFVIIDTPPVLAVTDPGIVSARVDGVIMALRIRKNGRPSAVRARKVLHDLDANMLGIVVNGIDHRSGSYGYYSSYRRGYGYNYAYKYGYGAVQDKTEKAINKYFEEAPEGSGVKSQSS